MRAICFSVYAYRLLFLKRGLKLLKKRRGEWYGLLSNNFIKWTFKLLSKKLFTKCLDKSIIVFKINIVFIIGPSKKSLCDIYF